MTVPPGTSNPNLPCVLLGGEGNVSFALKSMQSRWPEEVGARASEREAQNVPGYPG